MRMITRSMVALGFVGAIAGVSATPTSAQGIYLQGPGFDIGIGRPAYRDRYYRGYYDYNYAGPPVYSSRRYYGPPGVYYERRGNRWRDRDWD
jgi:hypothetical protein